MSDWTDDKAILTAALTGYTEIQGNLKANETGSTRSHKGYTITLGNPEATPLTDNAQIEVRKIKLEINFLQKNVAAYDANCEGFESLMSTIKSLSPFVSWITMTPPERFMDKAQNSTAILEFYFGMRTI